MSTPAGRDELRLASLHDKWVERQPEPPDVEPCDLCADMAEQVDMLRDTVAKQKRLLAELAKDIQIVLETMERLKS